jgi:putative peptidoglycan lipid II flippase
MNDAREGEDGEGTIAASAPPRRSIAKTALLLLPVQIVFRGGEAIVPLLLASWFGRTPETDVYYLAYAFFTFAGALIASAFQDSALIPVLADVQARAPKTFGTVAGSLLAHTLAYGTALAVVMGAIAVGWFRLRYEGALFMTSAWLVLPFALHLVALSVRAFFVGLLNTRGHYFAHPVASGLGITIAIALIAFARGALGVVILPLAWLAGEIAAIAVLTFVTSGLLKIPLTLSLARPEPVTRFFRLVFSEVTGSAITRINPVVDQVMAGLSSIVGAGTMLRYAFDVASLPTSAVQATILPVLLSHFSHDVASKNVDGFTRTVKKALAVVSAILVAMSVALAIFRRPILRAVFLHGEMDAAGVDGMAAILPFALLGVAPFGALLILARAHVALQNSRIMISMGILNAGLNLVFDLLFFVWIGLPGIALSTSMMQLAIAIVFWIRLKKRLAEEKAPTP